jgi:N-acetylglutamate synthase
MAISIRELEAVAAGGWRAPEQSALGDWLLRAADGFTGRANSALAVGDPGTPLAAAIEQVGRWYAARGLPAMVSVPFPLRRPQASAVDRFLAARGWSVRAGSATVMTADIRAVARQAAAARIPAAPGAAEVPQVPEIQVEIGAEPDDGWLAAYHYRGQAPPPIARRLLTSAPWQAFGCVRAGGAAIAIGRVAVAAGWAGLTAIEVDPRHRRRGLARAVSAALAAAALDRGATGIYLQVEDGNAAARALYHRIGFADHHCYHYRVAPAVR